MDGPHPDSVIEPFEARAYRVGFVVAIVVVQSSIGVESYGSR